MTDRMDASCPGGLTGCACCARADALRAAIIAIKVSASRHDIGRGFAPHYSVSADALEAAWVVVTEYS